MAQATPESMPTESPVRSSRIEYLRTTGCVLFTAVNANVVDEAEDGSLPPAVELEGSDFSYALPEHQEDDGINQANAGLVAVMNRLVGHTPALYLGDNKGFKRRFKITAQECTEAASHGVFGEGFGDRSFPWHFSAGVANAAVQAFSEGHISGSEAANLTLSDWADLISTGWFSRLMHSLAFTGNAVYRRFGDDHATMKRDSLKTQLTHLEVPGVTGDSPIFNTQWELEPADATWYLTATLRPEVRAGLREKMRKSDQSSTGCPVARKSILLTKEAFEANPRAAELVAKGIFSVKEKDGGAKVRLEQAYTAIDRTLLLIARQLQAYDQLHGTPRVKDGELVHEFVPRTNVLRRPDQWLVNEALPTEYCS